MPTPTPTPATLTLVEVRPAVGRNDVITSLDLYGFHFPPAAQVSLGSTALSTTFIDANHLAAKVPAGMAPGVYDVTVAGSGQSDTLVGAFTVQPAVAQVDDLFAEPYRLWSDPVSPYTGESISLGLVVNRLGGQSGIPIAPVRFYEGRISPETAIGDAYLTGIGVNDSRSTSALTWGSKAPGVYTIWAQIDPDGIVEETDESNNVISRTVTVLQREADVTPPVVDSLVIDGGAEMTSSRAISLSVQAHDNPGGSGVAKVFYVELHWNVGAQIWVPVQWTKWLPYGVEHTWQLHPESGLRYIQVWAADRAGNISLAPGAAGINYAPASQTVGAGETQVYRQEVAAGQCLRVQITPQSGDPDLYVWPPNYQSGETYWWSLNGAGQEDVVQFKASVSGVYQIEVEGYTAAVYRMSVAVSAACGRGGKAARAGNADKTLRSQPVVAVERMPPAKLAVPETALESLRSAKVYLPLLSRQTVGAVTAAKRVYLPQVVRPVMWPDLVVERLEATSQGVTVTVRNVGAGPVVDAFWVDVYVNPSQTPGVNQPWQTMAENGQVWGVQEEIAPGGLLTLTTGDARYYPQYSGALPLPVGAVVYALVDSVDFSTEYGSVRESNEGNNVYGPVLSRQAVGVGFQVQGKGGRPPALGLPAR